MTVYILMSEGTDGVAEVLNVYESHHTADHALKKQRDAYLQEGFKVAHQEDGWVQLYGGLLLTVTKHKVVTEQRIA